MIDHLTSLVAQFGAEELLSACWHAADARFVVTADRRISGGCPGAARLFGIPVRDSVPVEVLPPALACYLPRIDGVLAGQPGGSGPLVHLAPHDAPLTLFGTITPLGEAGNAPVALCEFHLVPRSADDDLTGHPQLRDDTNHQVRNSLAMICALLEMEILHEPDGDRQRLLVSLARIRTLALVHDFFMQDSLHQIEVGTLARAVMDSTLALFGRPGGDVAIRSDDPVQFDARRGTYLALALTELGVHLVRCAVAGETLAIPTLHITQDAQTITISVASGVTDDSDQQLNSLSRDILIGLVERSLSGKIVFGTDGQFTAVVSCPAPPLDAR